MLTKLLKVHQVSSRLFSSATSRLASANTEMGSTDSDPAEMGSAVLRIVLAGGIVECYYMAVPAARIMEKYPTFILARPQVFRDPWGSIVEADEILVPGEKFLVVAPGVVKKLRRRTNPKIMGEKRSRHVAWQPRLTSIDEI